MYRQFCIAIMLVLSALSVSAAQPSVDVIVGFHSTPDAALVHVHGGHVTHTYDLIPAVAATLPQQAVAALERNPRVDYIEADYEARILEEHLPWGIDRVEAEVVFGGSEDAVEVTSNAGAGVVVAVLDTGIDHTHPDLAENYAGGYDVVNGDSDPLDDHGHGTHVAGTVAAVDNQEGVIGAAPNVAISAVKVLDHRGSGSYSGIIAGIEWAVDNGADVISMSLGGSSGSSALQAAVDAAYEAGVLVVAAAGNSGDGDASTSEISYPAYYASVISVAATDSNDGVASFSSTNDDVELAAPGVNVLSTMPTYDVTMTKGAPWNSYENNYDHLSGTSMATPHVSGVAALVIAAGISDTNSNGVADEVRSILAESAEDFGPLGRDNAYGYGILNAAEAVALVGPAEPDSSAPVISNVSSTADATTATITWTTDEPASSVVRYNTTGATVQTVSDGTLVTDHSVFIEGLDPETTYSFEVESEDFSGNAAVDNNNGAYYTFSTPQQMLEIMRVNALELSAAVKGNSGKADLFVEASVVDDSGNAVADASIEITVSKDNGVYDTLHLVTDASGAVSATLKNAPTGHTYTANVVNVEKTGWTYDESTSVTSDSVTL